MYRSNDKGGTWKKVNEEDLYPVFSIYGWKFCDVRVSPDNENEIYILGNRGYHSLDGGKTYKRFGEKIFRLHDTRGKALHLDQHGDMMRMDTRGTSILSGGKFTRRIRPRAKKGEPNWRFGWYTPFIISKYNPGTLYAGGNKLLKSLDRGESWKAISPDLSDKSGGEWGVVPFGTITMISESPLKQGVIYAGTEGGSLYITRNDGGSWTKIDGGLPDKWVSRVQASMHEEHTVYVSFTGYREDDFKAYLYMSTDNGRNWLSITGNLPAESINVVREDPHKKNILYVGTDLGVYVSFNRGKSWYSLCNNLPTTPVHDLVIQPRDNDLVIGTHGRSVFVLDLKKIQD